MKPSKTGKRDVPVELRGRAGTRVCVKNNNLVGNAGEAAWAVIKVTLVGQAGAASGTLFMWG